MNDRIKRLLEREGTGISWADLTFNPWIGCQKVGPACDHCYAETFVLGRLGHMGIGWGPGEARKRTAPGNWAKPPRWNRYAADAGVTLNVFCASLADVFDNAVPGHWRVDLGVLIRQTPHLRWMLLTKRIGNVREMLPHMFATGGGVCPPNVALGVTVVTQDEVDRDLPRAIAVKQGLGVKRLFLSMEPLLGPVGLRRYLRTGAVDLVIVGGESGRHARPMPAYWVDDIKQACVAHGVPFHFKQQSQADYPRTYAQPETFHPRHQIREHFTS